MTRPWLNELALHHGTDKGSNQHDYARHYERLLGDKRDEPVQLLEIGTWRGGGLQMWEEYFPNGQITGIDIAPEAVVNTDRVRTIVMDIKDFVSNQVFDVIIDDGSHEHADVLAALVQTADNLLYGGFYFVEDVSSPIPGIEEAARNLGRTYEEVAPYLVMMKQLVAIG